MTKMINLVPPPFQIIMFNPSIFFQLLAPQLLCIFYPLIFLAYFYFFIGKPKLCIEKNTIETKTIF